MDISCGIFFGPTEQDILIRKTIGHVAPNEFIPDSIPLIIQFLDSLSKYPSNDMLTRVDPQIEIRHVPYLRKEVCELVNHSKLNTCPLVPHIYKLARQHRLHLDY